MQIMRGIDVEKQKHQERMEDEKNRNELAKTDDEARHRYEEYWSKDPYPLVAPALLNSADICKYVKKTGMIFPFYPEKLSGASYEAAIGGKVIWWDEKEGKQHEKDISKPGTYFELRPNSIAFVTLEPMLRIPDYIALRFNLKIMHVYKGLLLGTGPIVDPGFEGRLSIPLHNLTANTYIFHKGDGMIEMEFTKLSPNVAWDKEREKNGEKDGLYKRQWIKQNRNISDYILKALGEGNNTVVRSSIPDELKKVKEIVKQTKRDAKSIQKKQDKKINGMQLSTVLITIPVLAFACTAVYQMSSMAKDTSSSHYDLLDERNSQLDKRIAELEETVKEKTEKYEELRIQNSKLEHKVETLIKEVEKWDVQENGQNNAGDSR